jgi:hypothetical protein
MPDLTLAPRPVTRRLTLRLLGFRLVDHAWVDAAPRRRGRVLLTEEQLDGLTTRQWNLLIRRCLTRAAATN